MTLSPSLTAAAAVACLLTVPAPTALAAGVGTLELLPLEGSAFHLTVSGRPVQQQFTLRNIGTKPTSGVLYAAAARRTDSGGWSVSGDGSATWIKLPRQTVSLTPGQSKALTFTVDAERPRTGAVVLEQAGGSVVQRAATLVYVKKSRVITLPRALVLLAIVLLTAAGGAVLVVRRQRTG